MTLIVGDIKLMKQSLQTKATKNREKPKRSTYKNFRKKLTGNNRHAH